MSEAKQRYTVDRNDSRTYQVIDNQHDAEFCVVSEFPGEGEPPLERAERIARALNELEARERLN